MYAVPRFVLTEKLAFALNMRFSYIVCSLAYLNHGSVHKCRISLVGDQLSHSL